MVHIQLPHGAVLHVYTGWGHTRKCGAVILCPGGGYSYLEKWYEGYLWFPFFYLHDYIPAMLEYRMPQHDFRRPMTDGADALLMMRNHAMEWHFDSRHVGIMGSSAGGHLASTMLVAGSDVIRPDFGILFYPVISMQKELTHMDSHDQLLGEGAGRQLEDRFSNELHVSDKTPPTFIALASDDQAVSPKGAILFSDKMRATNRPVALHIYPSGGHGFVCHRNSKYREQVLDELAGWLRRLPENSQTD